MLPGTDSAVGKAVYAVVGVALIGFAVWRITSATEGGGGNVPYTVLCTECQHSETRKLAPGGGDALPLVCAKCEKKAVWIATPCPFCAEMVPLVDKKQPEKCPHCGKSTPDL